MENTSLFPEEYWEFGINNKTKFFLIKLEEEPSFNYIKEETSFDLKDFQQMETFYSNDEFRKRIYHFLIKSLENLGLFNNVSGIIYSPKSNDFILSIHLEISNESYIVRFRRKGIIIIQDHLCTLNYQDFVKHMEKFYSCKMIILSGYERIDYFGEYEESIPAYTFTKILKRTKYEYAEKSIKIPNILDN